MIQQEIVKIADELNALAAKDPEFWTKNLASIEHIQASLNKIAFSEDVIGCLLFDIQNEVLKMENGDAIQAKIDRYGMKVEPGERFKALYEKVQTMIDNERRKSETAEKIPNPDEKPQV